MASESEMELGISRWHGARVRESLPNEVLRRAGESVVPGTLYDSRRARPRGVETRLSAVDATRRTLNRRPKRVERKRREKIGKRGI